MDNYFEILKTVPLFDGLSDAELPALLSCLGVKPVKYEKGKEIFSVGEKTKRFGIILSGQVQIIKEDFYGNRHIIDQLGPRSLFAESFACAEDKTLPVSVVAASDSAFMFVDCRRLASPCENSCAFHQKLIRNMLGIVSQKNIGLMQKLEITSQRRTREKLLAYLGAEAQKAGSGSFSIPFDRQGLADYLGVERSAMSAELSKLRDEGVLRYDKSRFELL